MTTLPTLLRPLPLDGLFTSADTSAQKSLKPDSGVSFTDALRKASTDRSSRTRHELGDTRPKPAVSDNEPTIRTGDNASDRSQVETDGVSQTTDTNDDQISSSDASQDTSKAGENSDSDSNSHA